MNLTLPKLDPDLAYIGTSLFLPRRHIEEGPVRSALTFGFDKEVEPRILVRDHLHHLEVPRAFLNPEQLTELDIHFVDLRQRVQFQKTSLRPKPSFRLRPRQVKAWEKIHKTDSGILVMACGSGKTILGWRKAAELKVPTLVISHQKAHLKNWEQELRDHFELDEETGWIDDKRMEWDRAVVFSTIQRLAGRSDSGGLPPGFSSHFGLVIYDEVHHLAAKFFVKAADLTIGSRLGLTATPKRNDRCEGVYYSHLGKVFYKDLDQEIAPQFFVVDTNVTIPGDEESEVTDRSGQRHAGLLRVWLGKNLHRNGVIRGIIDYCVSQGRKTYVLTHSPDHAELLHAMYPNSGCISGRTRKNRLKILNSHDLLFATMGIGTEAYNRSDLDALLLLTPFSANDYTAIAFQQSVGRLQRATPGKTDAWVFLFMDRGIDESRGMTFSLIREAKRQGFGVTGWNTTLNRRTPRGW